MLDTPVLIESLRAAGRSQDEMKRLCDEMIAQEEAAIMFYQDQLSDRLKRLEEQVLNANTDYNIKLEYSNKRIALFHSMRDRLCGKEVALVLPMNPIFAPAEEPRRKLFARKK